MSVVNESEHVASRISKRKRTDSEMTPRKSRTFSASKEDAESAPPQTTKGVVDDIVGQR
jgi:hypothetical protein